MSAREELGRTIDGILARIGARLARMELREEARDDADWVMGHIEDIKKDIAECNIGEVLFDVREAATRVQLLRTHSALVADAMDEEEGNLIGVLALTIRKACRCGTQPAAGETEIRVRKKAVKMKKDYLTKLGRIGKKESDMRPHALDYYEKTLDAIREVRKCNIKSTLEAVDSMGSPVAEMVEIETESGGGIVDIDKELMEDLGRLYSENCKCEPTVEGFSVLDGERDEDGKRA